jgi:competence protein ComEC
MQRHALVFGFATISGTLLILPELVGLLSLIGLLAGLRLWSVGRGLSVPKWLPGISVPLSLLVVASIGMAWGHSWVSWQLLHRLPADQDKTDVRLVLQVTGAEQAERWQRLQVSVIPSEFSSESSPVASDLPPLRHLQLNYYQREPVLAPGDRLTAQVRLKAIRGLANGLPFDYEAWMLRQRIDARGYIRRLIQHEVVSESAVAEPLRIRWLKHRQEHTSESAWPWVAGLVFGEQSAFSDAQWQLTQQTGTLHLLVVSGLHMGMLAAMVVAFIAVLRRLLIGSFSARIRQGQGVLWLQALLVLFCAGWYVYLAGSGVALQRAFVMLLALLLILLFARRLSALAALSYAFAVILAINPLMYTGAGFSFSMVAVASLLLFLHGRKLRWLAGFWIPHWVVFSGLLPVMLWWGQTVGLVHLICNAIAIPLMGLVLLPLALMTAAWPEGVWEHWLVATGDLFWQGLELAVRWPLPEVSWLSGEALLMWVALLVLVALGVRPVIAVLALVLSLSALMGLSPRAMNRIVLADVGQGQAMIVVAQSDVSAQASALVLDVGPRFSDRFNAGKAIVAPQLRRLGVEVVNDLVVSHSDLDHAGGWEGLVTSGLVFENQWYGQKGTMDKAIPVQVKEVLGCHSSDAWQVRNEYLSFRFLSVPKRYRLDDNDASCVVQVRWFGHTLLVPGDASVRVERALVARYGSELASDILVLSHHGSRSSTSRVFLAAVNPARVWASAGFNNRFGHPHPDVLARVSRQDSPVWVTAQSGAVILMPDGELDTVRAGWHPPWRQR